MPQALAMSCSLQVFLGRLRESEMERLHERISSAVMETCLAMTIFREDFNVESVAMFVMLTFVKVQPLRWHGALQLRTCFPRD